MPSDVLLLMRKVDIVDIRREQRVIFFVDRTAELAGKRIIKKSFQRLRVE